MEYVNIIAALQFLAGVVCGLTGLWLLDRKLTRNDEKRKKIRHLFVRLCVACQTPLTVHDTINTEGKCPYCGNASKSAITEHLCVPVEVIRKNRLTHPS